MVDQVPVEVVRAMGANFTFGVSLSLAFLPQKVDSALAAISAVIGVLGVHQLRRSLDRADVGFQVPGIEQRSIINPGQHDLIDLGEQKMNARLRLLEQQQTIRRLSCGQRSVPQESRKLVVSH